MYLLNKWVDMIQLQLKPCIIFFMVINGILIPWTGLQLKSKLVKGPYLPTHLPTYPTYLPTLPTLPTYLPIPLSIYLSVYLSIYLSVYLSFCLSIYISIVIPMITLGLHIETPAHRRSWLRRRCGLGQNFPWISLEGKTILWWNCYWDTTI